MKLKEEAKREISSIPKQQRVLITAHDAFHYFGRAYDIEVVGLQGLSTDAEYGLKDIQELVDLIVSRNIQAVFVESSVSKKRSKQLSRERNSVDIMSRLVGSSFQMRSAEKGQKKGHSLVCIVTTSKRLHKR